MAFKSDGISTMEVPMATPTKHDNMVYTPPGRKISAEEGVDMASTFYEFPKTRPFINTNYKQSPIKPVIPYPETSRDGIYSAMKNLQEKVRRLELERTNAEDNLKTLSNETTKYSICLQKSQEAEDLANKIVTKQTKEIESQLSAAETRCGMLEKQLDYMRKMLHNSQQEQLESARRRLELEKQQHLNKQLPVEIEDKLKKIPELEREHLKLTATQSISENKIKELEQKLHEEDVHRKLILERAQDMQEKTTTLSNGLIPNNTLDEQPIKLQSKPKKVVKKKKNKVLSERTGRHQHNGHVKRSCSKYNDPSSHYRLNLAEIPFVAGQSTGPSHSVGANIQKVISMMKSHNLALCSSMYNGGSGTLSSSSSTTSLDNDMTEILQQLQDEFGQLSFEHKELCHQIEETGDLGVRHDLKRELDRVVKRLEMKSQQISKVRAHQQKLSDMKKKVKSKKKEPPTYKPPQRPASAKARLNSRPASRPPTNSRQISSPRSLGGTAKVVLNDMRKLQTTLRKDDVSWE